MLNLPPNTPNCTNPQPGDQQLVGNVVWTFEGYRADANGNNVAVWIPANGVERGNILYRGPINLTADPSTQYNNIVAGNVFNITTGANPVNNTWYPGLAADQSAEGELGFDGTNWFRLSSVVPYATETTAGIIEIGTKAEVKALASKLVAVTPLYLKDVVDTKIDLPSGGSDGQFLQRVSGNPSWQDLPTAATGTAGIIQIAASTDTTSTTKAVTPAMLATAVSGAGGDTIPAGTVSWYAGRTAPPGWLECNGQSVTYTDYTALWTVLGGTDQAVAVNVPDLRGEFVRGYDHGRGIDKPGGVSRTLMSAQDSELGPHTHDVSGGGAGKQVPTVGGGTQIGGAQVGQSYTGTEIITLGGTVENTGTNIGTETRPRNIALMGIIKT